MSSAHDQDWQVSVLHQSSELEADTQQADTSLPLCLYSDENVLSNHSWPQLPRAGTVSHPVLLAGELGKYQAINTATDLIAAHPALKGSWEQTPCRHIIFSITAKYQALKHQRTIGK